MLSDDDFKGIVYPIPKTFAWTQLSTGLEIFRIPSTGEAIFLELSLNI